MPERLLTSLAMMYIFGAGACWGAFRKGREDPWYLDAAIAIFWPVAVLFTLLLEYGQRHHE